MTKLQMDKIHRDGYMDVSGVVSLTVPAPSFPTYSSSVLPPVARTFKFNVPVVTAVTWGQAGDTLEIVAR